MSTAGQARPAGLFAALKRLGAGLLEIGKTRLELLLLEVETQKLHLLGLLAKLLGALFFTGLAIVLAVFALAFAFWEQRVLVFGLAAGLCLLLGVGLGWALRRQTAHPVKLAEATLSELEADIAALRQEAAAMPARRDS